MKSADELELSSFRYGGVKITGLSLMRRDLTSAYLRDVMSTDFNRQRSYPTTAGHPRPLLTVRAIRHGRVHNLLVGVFSRTRPLFRGADSEGPLFRQYQRVGLVGVSVVRFRVSVRDRTVGTADLFRIAGWNRLSYKRATAEGRWTPLV